MQHPAAGCCLTSNVGSAAVANCLACANYCRRWRCRPQPPHQHPHPHLDPHLDPHLCSSLRPPRQVGESDCVCFDMKV